MTTQFTDKYIKNELIYLDNKDFKSTDFTDGVYNSILSLKTIDEDEKENIIAKAYCFFVNGEVADILDAADSETGDLFLVADTMINDFNIDHQSSIAIIDKYALLASQATVASKKFLLEEYIIPYFRDRGIKYLGFCNGEFELTNDANKQSKIDKIFEDMPIIDSEKTWGDDWKSIVQLISINKATDKTESIDPFLKEYENQNKAKLPENFDNEYDKYIFDDATNMSIDIKKTVSKVYNFKKDIYFSEDGRRINLTSEDKNIMNSFKKIRNEFKNIEELSQRTIDSYKNLITTFISEDETINPNTMVGAFLAEANMFMDYLNKEWLPHYVPVFQETWRKIRSYIYDTNLGYRLCYNLRNFDQHPQNHSASQIIKETADNVGENRVEYYLNVVAIYNDKKVQRKMSSDFSKLQENPEFAEYARDYMINITSLYNLALAQFFVENIDTLREVYDYLYENKFSKTVIKSVDNTTLKIEGIDFADEIISTNDIDFFLHQFEKKGIIDINNIADIRNGNEDTPDTFLTPEQIVKNIVIRNYLYDD